MAEISSKDINSIIEKMGEQNREALKEAVAAAVAAAVAESKKPAPLTPQQESELAMKQQHRAEEAGQQLAIIKNKFAKQEICSHERPARDQLLGPKTYCVWVRESDPVGSLGYILCQDCLGRFRPETADKKLDPGAHYSTALFNKLFQECSYTAA